MMEKVISGTVGTDRNEEMEEPEFESLDSGSDAESSDDEAEEYLEINLNVKQKGDIQTNVHNASSLYALIGGIQNLNNPQWTTLFNRIKKVDLSEWEEYINSKESMTVEIVTKSGSNFTYNSFRITDLS